MDEAEIEGEFSRACEKSKFRIFMAGDSTMQYNDCTTYPQTGWGQVLPLFLPPNVCVHNFAKNGRSTKSFIAEGRLDAVKKMLSCGDYLFIQFGHNDEKLHDKTRGTQPSEEYTDNLAEFAQAAIRNHALPVFFTPIARRQYAADGSGRLEDTHGDYPAAMIRYARAAHFPVIDMNSLTRAFLEKTGEQASREFFMNFDAGIYGRYMDGKQDNTHLRYAGAFETARIAAEELRGIGDAFPDYKPLSEAIILPGNETIDSTER
ncbi:MAG: rhamnogalacturonan acetylesterase [Bacteroides sp.]|nr:rhamnogalacturonan acetylesterase [Prevotella sp.]MCM1407566.1 rhamnogalacturonan acetylesterase [Treponema brennaborense]MCM1469284.1 rhamnogalacturonan acetylesterase [Bacteroides sp.]